jgi:putative heme uptake system protein
VIGRRPGRRATAPGGPPRFSPLPPGPAADPVTDPAGAPHVTDGVAARHTAPVSDTLAPGTLTDSGTLPDAGAEADGRVRPALDLLIWDAPNIDMTLSTVIGARPTAASRPRFDAIAAWFVEGAGDPTAPDASDVEACVFANIPPQPGTLQRWVEALRGFGFAVFARPKTQPDDDIDQDMLDHIAVRAHSHRLRRLVVFSGDGRNFAEPLEQLVREGTQVVVVAFSEVAGYAISSDLLQFIDIEDVPGAFTEPLDRVRLDALPPDGAWLRPTRSLRDFVSSWTARRNG